MAFSDWLNRVFGHGSGIDKFFTGIDKNLLGGAIGSAKQNAGNIVSGFINGYSQGDLTPAERERMQYQTAERESAQDWTAEREDTQYQRMMADMKAAGINPMMAAGGSPASSSSSGQSAPGSMAPADMSELMNLGMYEKQEKLLDAQIANITQDTKNKSATEKKTLAEILHINEDTSRIKEYEKVLRETSEKLRIENYVSDVLKGVRVEQERMNLTLTDEQIKQVTQLVKESEQRVNLMVEQAESEDVKQALMNVQKTLAGLDVQDKTKYLVYADALYKARSDKEKNEALDAAVRYAYDKQLLTADYAKAILDKAKAEQAISKNVQWSEELVHDLVVNNKRPAKYKGQLSSSEWSQLREGLIDPVFFNSSVYGYSRTENKGSIINRN